MGQPREPHFMNHLQELAATVPSERCVLEPPGVGSGGARFRFREEVSRAEYVRTKRVIVLFCAACPVPQVLPIGEATEMEKCASPRSHVLCVGVNTPQISKIWSEKKNVT